MTENRYSQDQGEVVESGHYQEVVEGGHYQDHLHVHSPTLGGWLAYVLQFLMQAAQAFILQLQVALLHLPEHHGSTARQLAVCWDQQSLGRMMEGRPWRGSHQWTLHS